MFDCLCSERRGNPDPKNNTNKMHPSVVLTLIAFTSTTTNFGVEAWGGVFNRFSPEMLSNLGYGGHGGYLERSSLQVNNADKYQNIKLRYCPSTRYTPTQLAFCCSTYTFHTLPIDISFSPRGCTCMNLTVLYVLLHL